MTSAFLGRAHEPLGTAPGGAASTSTGGASLAEALGVAGRLVLHAAPGGAEPFGLGLPDGNRSVVVPDRTVRLGGRTYALSVKGAGALAPLYGETPVDFAFRSDFAGGRPRDGRALLDDARVFASESWFGEAPYGAQGEAGQTIAREVSELATGACLNGFWICPSVQWVELPEQIVTAARERFWYRRHPGRFLQEHRLVPSDVRLFHASERTLGQSPDLVLAAFGVDTPARLDAFLERLLASGLAALTLYPRTLREGRWGLEGLDYANVWLDKDSVVAPDGTLHFADLEGLDWECCGRDWPFETRVRVQLDRNYYELFYAVHVLLLARERMTGEPLPPAERRRVLATRVELALDGDPVLSCERGDRALDLVARSPLLPAEPVRIRLLDLR